MSARQSEHLLARRSFFSKLGLGLAAGGAAAAADPSPAQAHACARHSRTSVLGSPSPPISASACARPAIGSTEMTRSTRRNGGR